MRFKLFAVGAALMAAPAAAEPGYYFHKPGVERSAFETELSNCVTLAGGISVQRRSVSTVNPYAAAVGGFLSGLLAARERRTMVENIMRTCMTDKGYRRVAADKLLLKVLADLSDAQRLTRIHELASQPGAEGEVLPR